MSTSLKNLLVRSASVATCGGLLFALDRGLATADLSPIHLRGSLVLLAGHTLVALGAALVGLLWVALFRLWCRARRTRGRPLIGGVLLALLGAAPLYAVSAELVRGDWISKQSFAPALKYGAVIAGMLGLLLLGWLYSRATTMTPTNTGTPPGRQRTRFVLPVVLVLGGALFAVADVHLLPGLYPELHALLYGFSVVFTLLAACLFGDLLLAAPRARAIAGPAGVMVLAVSVVLVPAFGPATLSELALGSRTAALIVPLIPMPSHVIWQELARMTVRDEARVDAPGSKEAVDRLLGGRRDYNVLLVIVDTLRADALLPARGEGQPFAQAGDTPFLDAWLSKSFRFRRAYSQASRTRRSLPPTFRSLEASEDAENVGIPLGAQATELGLLPVAVVPQYFLLPESEAAQHLLLGFDRVSFYEKDHQEVLVDRARDTFEALKGQRFLAWVHFYNMHAPYFAGPSATAAGLTVAERYRMALLWLDGEMKRLMAALEEAGLADDTVIIFTADHGENVRLNGGRVGHGGTVYEPEVRVPLAVYIPGQEGAEIDIVAGNIDIVPTIFDIVGATPKSTHRGRSLLPIFAGVENQHEPVYFENSGGSMQGVAIGGQKLVRRDGGGVFHRFELLHDPTETTDLYTGETEVDRVLRRAMLRKNPALFADELVESEVLEKLLERLAEVEAGATAGSDLELLLKLAALSNDPDALAQGARIFNDARDVDTALLAVRYLYPTDTARWGQLLGARLAKLVGQPNELALVRGLAMQGQPAFAEKAIAARLRTLAEQPPDEWAAWLALVRSWKKAPHLYARPLEALLGAILIGPRTADETAALVSVLESVSTLGGGKGAANLTGLKLQVRPWLDDADPRVAVRAARALGTLRDAYAPKLFRAALADRALDVRVRQAILHALVAIEGKKATATIIEEGENPLLTVDALQILGRLKDRAALPFLKGIAKTHYNGYTRGEANRAIDLIKGKAKSAPATKIPATATTPEKAAAPAATGP